MIRRVIWSVLPACMLLLALSGTVAGHAELVESDPPDEGSIDSTPATLTATYDEELDPDPDLSWIRVRNEANEIVARGRVTADDQTVMTVELPPLPPGEYRARWQAFTPDDDATERGTINFTIESAAATGSPVGSGGPSPRATPARTGPATATPSAAASARPSPSPEDIDGDTSVAAVAAVLVALVVLLIISLILYRRSKR